MLSDESPDGMIVCGLCDGTGSYITQHSTSNESCMVPDIETEKVGCVCGDGFIPGPKIGDNE